MQGFFSSFSDLTGYFGQGDDLYSGREALKAHFLGRRSNHVITLSTERIRGVFDFILLPFYLFTSLFSNIGDNVQLKCKGGKFG